MDYSYREDYEHSLNTPEAFWGREAMLLDWHTHPRTISTPKPNGTAAWFEDGRLNTSWLALDHHVLSGRGDQIAMIYESPVTGVTLQITYSELLKSVATFAGALTNLGLSKGDTAVIYMPMIPQAVIAMLACARIGVIHSVVFGGFAAHELAIRIDDARPSVIIAASGGIEIARKIAYQPIIEAALEESSHQPEHVVVWERPEIVLNELKLRWIKWTSLVEDASPVDAIPVESTHPLYILYTSGTTGTPKGIIRDHGGHAVALRYSMKAIYGIDPGDVYWAASDVGWVVGHSYIVYAPLLTGCTTILFEGKPIRTPDAGTFWRVIRDHQVNVLFTAPTAIRAIKKEDPQGTFLEGVDISSLRHLFLAGERCDVATYSWAKDLLNVPVIDHWWQTESGWPMLANPVGYGLEPVKPGSAGFPVPGFDLQILRPDGTECEPNEEGAVVIRLPLPPSCLPGLWRNEERFQSGYLDRYPGYYLAGDGGYKDQDGYVFITGRIDDVINVAGHRLSTAEMEEVVASHPDVAECAVIGAANELKGQIPLGMIVLKSGVTSSPASIIAELILRVRETVGPVASFKQVVIVDRLPKTRSGKILRKILRAIADGTDFMVPSTIDDPAVLTEIKEVLAQVPYG